MGMLPSYIKLVGSMHTRYRFEGPVCSLGNQDIWASLPELTVPTQGSYVRRGNLAEAPAEVTQSAFDRLLPVWLQSLARPLRPLLRMAYRKYRRAQTRRAASINYI
jgi:hypothetical protein